MTTSVEATIHTTKAWELPRIGQRKRVMVNGTPTLLTVNEIRVRRANNYNTPTGKRVDVYIARVSYGGFHDV